VKKRTAHSKGVERNKHGPAQKNSWRDLGDGKEGAEKMPGVRRVMRRRGETTRGDY